MFTILGAGGAISNELSKVLAENKIPFTLVSRHPVSIYGAATKVADLTSASQTNEAVRGSSVVVLCPGLPYDIRVWTKQWPAIMANAIEACEEHNARLIFFDNVYMLGKVNGPMNEETPVHPTSKKGELRAKIAEQLMDEIKAGNLYAMIARAADFYGPDCKTGFLNALIFDKMIVGKRSQWLINDNVVHSYTFTPDCGRALYLLSQSESAWNQVWHMPTAAPPLTGKELIDLAAGIFNASPRHTVIGKGMISIAGIFNRLMYELKEMLYQNDSTYIFDSSKFNKAFNFIPTSYEEGFKIVAASYTNTNYKKNLA
ncbi:MAG TPA: NAD-dependent epimerase/dehydratase family protein [Chitinophagaceae bacterium]|nr:NAD-dependent epimerase/dehydratase family protein [Chitinophagaceae bacterium]